MMAFSAWLGKSPDRLVWDHDGVDKYCYGRYAEAGLTELFLEANFDPTGPRVERVIDVMEALAPAREDG